MSSPLPPVPGETPEQRQARFAAAAAVQNRIDQQARDEEARRAAAKYAAMVAATPQSAAPAPMPQPVAMPLTLSGVPQNLTLNNVPMQNVANPQSHISDYIANMNAPAAEQKPDIVQMLGKYNLGAAPGTLGGTLGGIGLQSVDAPAPTTPPAALPPANPDNTPDDFIPRNVRSPMTVMDTLNLARTLGTAPQQLASIVGMPMAGYDPAGYDPAAQYRGFGNDLMALINSGAITPQQANAIKAPVFEAVRLGNTNQGYNQMQAALAAGRQQMGQYMPQPQPMPIAQAQPMPQPVAPPLPVEPRQDFAVQRGDMPLPPAAQPQGLTLSGPGVGQRLTIGGG